VIVGPTSDDRVELTYQVALADTATTANQLPHLFQECVRVFLGGLDKQFVAVLAEILSEEVKPLLDRRDAGLLGRELQAPVEHELLDQWLNFIFQPFLGGAGNDEVIRIANEVYPRTRRALYRELLFEHPFQSVQSQVSQRGRDDAPYTMDNNSLRHRWRCGLRPLEANNGGS